MLSNSTDTSPQSVYIVFLFGEIISIICILFGILGNSALILTIYRSTFYSLPFGLLLLFIALFDIIRLCSTIFYYLLLTSLVPLNMLTLTIYINFYRYPKNITNWLKVFLAFERILTIKSWLINRYSINKQQRRKHKRTLISIFILLICSLISQHPNLISARFHSPRVDTNTLVLNAIPNEDYSYGQIKYNGIWFTIISFIILDDLLPVTLLIILNTILLFKLRRLPLLANEKMAGTLWVLFILTIFSIFVAPRSIITCLNLYFDPNGMNNTVLSIVYHVFQGLEMINHAMTGYACFLSCQNLRANFSDFLRNLYAKSVSHFKLTTITSSKT